MLKNVENAVYAVLTVKGGMSLGKTDIFWCETVENNSHFNRHGNSINRQRGVYFSNFEVRIIFVRISRRLQADRMR